MASRHWLVALALFGASGALAFSPARHAARRTYCPLGLAPVGIVLERLDAPTPGTPFRLRLSANALANVADATLTIEVPAGVQVASGAPTWHGALARGEHRQLEVSVIVPSTAPFTFNGLVQTRSSASTLMRQYPLQVGKALATAAIHLPAPVITAPDGTRMMVLPARQGP
jgi:hypothetical protein